jgi:hypothetical protein
MKAYVFWLFFFFVISLQAQEIYVVNSINEIKVINVQTLSVSDLVTVDVLETGYLTDIAFSPDGTLYAVTNGWQIFEIDLSNGEASLVADLPVGDPYTALVSNSQNELLTSRTFSEELYRYNLDTDNLQFVDNNISSPGDFTFYKGNLIYPNILNDFIKAYDGDSIINIGCSIPLLYTFVNDFVDCETNNIYGFDQFATLYRFDVETEDYEPIAEFFDQTGLLNGGATLSEWMASDCALEPLETVLCLPLSAGDFDSPAISLKANPVTEQIEFEINNALDVSYVLYNIDGKLLKIGPLEGDTISISEFSKGVYLIQLTDISGQVVLLGRVIKN